MKKYGDGHGKGPAKTKAEWLLLASNQILNLLDEQLAVPHAELEARLCQQGFQYDGTRQWLHPHIVTEALRDLRILHAVEEVTHETRGGRSVRLLVVADRRRRETAVMRAIRRKGLLYARFLLLSNHTGDAGEEVLRHSLTTAGAHLVPMEPGFGEVRNLMGVKLYGALDSGAWLHSVDPATGLPRMPFALPMEMKNRRQVLYPIHKEVHQILGKAAVLQTTHPDFPIVPILVCREAHPWLFWMAHDLGFLVHPARRQFAPLPKGMTQKLFDELRTELGLTDLTLVTDESRPSIQQFFRETIIKQAAKAAPRWAAAAGTVAPYAERLRTEDMDPGDRLELIRDLRQELEPVMRTAGFNEPLYSWSLPDEEDWQDQSPHVDDTPVDP